jgi:nicotinamide-nucleotide amidase
MNLGFAGVAGATRLYAEAAGRARALDAALADRHLTLGTAESCTGGLIGALITAVPGSSAWYRGGVVAYANELKVDLLGVRPETLAADGAVSAATAGEMASGARIRLRVDLAVSVTGIAGPAGGSDDKPVGLVFIGLATPRGVRVSRHVFPGDRDAVRAAAAARALAGCLEEVGQP